MVCCCSASDLNIAWPVVWPIVCSVSQHNVIVCHKAAMLAHILMFILLFQLLGTLNNYASLLLPWPTVNCSAFLECVLLTM